MIKKARKNDAKILATMAIKIWDNESIDELENEFIDISQSTDSICFIKYIDKKAVAFANVALRYDYVEGCQTSPVGYLEGIFVERNYRKNYYGKDLVKRCELWARSKGCVEFASDCLLENKDSLAFHLAIGFVEANRIICFKKSL